MWTSALFGAKKLKFFRGGWVKLVRTFIGKGGEGELIFDFVRTSLWTAPY